MDLIIKNKEIIIQTLLILLPVLSVMIPKIISDIRTRKLLGSIENGADLKSTAYVQILAELAQFKNLVQPIVNSKEIFENINESFNNLTDDFKMVGIIKDEIKDTQVNINKLMNQIQDLTLINQDTINVKVVIEEQNKKIQELSEVVGKLNNRLGGN